MTDTHHPTEIAAKTASPRKPRRRRVWRWVGFVLLALVVLLITARLMLPADLRDYVNRTLDQSPAYDGSIGDVDVHLWRGSYSILDIQIVKTTHSVPVPFFQARRVDFSLDWSSLMQGEARGRVVMESPRINFVHGPTEGESQTGVDQPWLAMIEDLFPFRIDKAEIIDGEIHFAAFHTSPQVDIYLSQVWAGVTNLTNVEDNLEPMMANIQAYGQAMESGYFELDMKLDPNSHRPTFSLATRLLYLDVTQINALARAYGDFDFERGEFDLVVELSAKDGAVEGYAKPLFRDLKVLSLKDLEAKDPLQLFWEALVGIVGEVFKNQSRDQFGTRITLTGDVENPRLNLMEIIGNVLRNAFVRAYLPRLEGRVAPEVVTPEETE